MWDDGHESLWTHRQLRLACECATCVDEWSRKPLLDPERVPEHIRIVRAEPTGNYGVQLTFSDGHNTGIYTFRRLRDLEGDVN